MEPSSNKLLTFLTSKGFEIQEQTDDSSFTAYISKGSGEQFALNCEKHECCLYLLSNRKSVTLIPKMPMTHIQDALMVLLSCKGFTETHPKLSEELKDKMYEIF
ncbi:hypothetical protein R9C00_19320 [Flammeovirgaceae bacterium SG7u.111]|nr:hypothetical protein [Flammeovirgaceae bacterium SG7u.132]WPO33852.1 hypothetical protein R9C00_19320 [Flammeovirgaceae bacterium SG7u.111]